jgi:hypothetical protein
MNSVEEAHRLSRISTLKLIESFESRGIIKIEKPTRTGKRHRLILNQGNIFNLINDWISETEVVADIAIKNLDIIRSLSKEKYSENSKAPTELEKLQTHFRLLLEIVNFMIDFLLIKTYDRVESVEDALRLSIRIVKLLVRTLNYTITPIAPVTLIEYFGLSNVGITESVKKYAKRRGIDIDNLSYLVEKIDDFEKQFLRKKMLRLKNESNKLDSSSPVIQNSSSK